MCELSKKRGAVEPPTSLARLEEVGLEVLRTAVLVTANLSSCVGTRRAVEYERMLPLIILLSSPPFEQVGQYAAFALVKVALDANLRLLVTDKGGLNPCLSFAHDAYARRRHQKAGRLEPPSSCEPWSDDEIAVPFTANCANTFLTRRIANEKEMCAGKKCLTPTLFAPPHLLV
ncbi:hypothetical protein PybrP1_010047 [[Pythium] brassicae (nom. inval.)]|nr:hypothetical protein PybrP1_010047 [[Pythium] brassicae (nom. inval.)]